MVERFIYDPYGTVTVLNSSWGSTTDAYGWKTLFQGMRCDSTTGNYTTPNRGYNPTLGTWLEGDPAGYVDGANLYQGEGSRPTTSVDPAGTTIRVAVNEPINGILDQNKLKDHYEPVPARKNEIDVKDGIYTPVKRDYIDYRVKAGDKMKVGDDLLRRYSTK